MTCVLFLVDFCTTTPPFPFIIVFCFLVQRRPPARTRAGAKRKNVRPNVPRNKTSSSLAALLLTAAPGFAVFNDPPTTAPAAPSECSAAPVARMAREREGEGGESEGDGGQRRA